MFKIDWNDSIIVGVPSIDEDHKRLIDILNELFEACFVGQGPEVLGGVIDRLIDYTKVHFTREIALLKSIGYARLDAHQAEHEKLVAQVEKIQADFKTGATHELGSETLTFLRHWLTDHIQAEDREFGSLLRGKVS